MPRYVFTGFNKPIDWEKIRKDVPTVYGYMQFGLGPTKMRIEDVRWLLNTREQYAGRKQPTVVEDVIKVGDKVRVIQGPFHGESLTVDKVVADKIHAIRNFLGAPRLFKIPVADVAAL
jgi:transcription antitermination factor NusG